PSMVVIARPSACAKVIWHEGKACPSTITKQAPHSPVPQPYFVPVRLAPQRRAQRKGVSASMRRSTGWPLSVKADMNAPCPPAPVTSSQSALLQTKPQAGPDRARHANIHAARLIAGDDRDIGQIFPAQNKADAMAQRRLHKGTDRGGRRHQIGLQ
ncbi:hypothetical protein KXV42_009029, partial [Aspergillus fumigatus]